MNSIFQNFTSTPIDYLLVDRHLTVVEISGKVSRFAEVPEGEVLGEDVRLCLPEAIGIEDILIDIMKGERESFELRGISRTINQSPPLYIDIYFNRFNTQLLISVINVTGRMVVAQELGQVAKEYSLALTSLETTKNYLAQIIGSLKEILLVATIDGRIKTVNQALQDTLEYSQSDLIDRPISILLAGTDFSKQEIQQHLLSPENLQDVEVVCQTKTGKTIVVAFSRSLVDLEGEESRNFLYIGRDITERLQAEIQLRLQAERDRLLAAITQRIRQSLSLAEILKTAVAEVRQLLQTNWVQVYSFSENNSAVVAQSVAPSDCSTSASIVPITYWQTYCAPFYQQGEICTIADIDGELLNRRDRDGLAALQIRAILVVPILQSTKKSPNHLWGVLTVHHCCEPRQWEQWEIEFLHSLAAQLSVAIQQAELYERLQAANRELEKLATVDGLTQIANRRRFDQCLQAEWRAIAPLAHSVRYRLFQKIQRCLRSSRGRFLFATGRRGAAPLRQTPRRSRRSLRWRRVCDRSAQHGSQRCRSRRANH